MQCSADRPTRWRTPSLARTVRLARLQSLHLPWGVPRRPMDLCQADGHPRRRRGPPPRCISACVLMEDPPSWTHSWRQRPPRRALVAGLSGGCTISVQLGVASHPVAEYHNLWSRTHIGAVLAEEVGNHTVLLGGGPGAPHVRRGGLGAGHPRKLHRRASRAACSRRACSSSWLTWPAPTPRPPLSRA